MTVRGTKYIFVRPERCMGCRNCEISCAVEHSKEKTLFSALRENPFPRKRLFIENGDTQPVLIMCRNCDEAPCVKECVTGSLHRDENGFVLIDGERCIGCWSCILACPFGAIKRDEDNGTALKCDRCGGSAVPACVSSCLTRSLTLVDLEEQNRQKRKRAVIGDIQAPDRERMR